MSKQTEQNMVETCNSIIYVCKRIVAETKYRDSQLPERIVFKGDASSMRSVLNVHMASLTQNTYEEAHLEQVVNTVVQRAKQRLLELIQKSNSFSENQKKADQILKDIERQMNTIMTSSAIDVSLLNQLKASAERYKRLIENDEEIEASLALIAADLEKIMGILKKQ